MILPHTIAECLKQIAARDLIIAEAVKERMNLRLHLAKLSKILAPTPQTVAIPLAEIKAEYQRVKLDLPGIEGAM